MLKEIDPEITVGAVQPLQSAVDEQLSRPRFLATLFASFGLFAMLLALMGVYGVIAYAVRQREHEVAVRMAVGADAKSIMRLFIGDGALVLAFGVSLGSLAAWGMGRLLGSQLFGVQPLGSRISRFSCAGTFRGLPRCDLVAGAPCDWHRSGHRAARGVIDPGLGVPRVFSPCPTLVQCVRNEART